VDSNHGPTDYEMSFPKGRHLDSIAYSRKTSYDSGLHRAIRRSTDNLVTTRYARIPNIPRQGPMTLTRVHVVCLATDTPDSPHLLVPKMRGEIYIGVS